MTNRGLELRLYATELVLAVLGFEEAVLLNDVEVNLRFVWTLQQSAQDRAVSLMESPKLQTWLISIDPSTLFVNRNYDGAVRQSPLSYVCTKLIDSICEWTDDMRPKSPSILAQAFFCGQHMELDDPENGPCGIMRSLLSQLILSYKSI